MKNFCGIKRIFIALGVHPWLGLNRPFGTHYEL